MKKKIAVLPGDGIGPEVMQQALRVLTLTGKHFGHDFATTYGHAGGEAADVDGGGYLILLQIAQGDEEIVFEHEIFLRPMDGSELGATCIKCWESLGCGW